jgi:hypothetical protein
MTTLSELREDIARMIDPSSWRVFDAELRQVKRIPNAGYDPDNFKDRQSLALADQILRRVEGYLETRDDTALTA